MAMLLDKQATRTTTVIEAAGTKQETIMKIEKGVPLPTRSRYAMHLGDLDVGDSIFMNQNEFPHQISPAIAAYGRTHNKKFSYRSVEGGVRIWRVK